MLNKTDLEAKNHTTKDLDTDTREMCKRDSDKKSNGQLPFVLISRNLK